ncbi:MAG TPA: M28 family peptidase [Terriglobales bacterium]|nr:M28 family peptidase [Terriglobales bacterium]
MTAKPAVRLRATVFLLVLALVAPQLWAATAPADPARYLNDVRKLADPRMEGRGAGTRGLNKARDYVEREFKRLGLEPAGEAGKYTQWFDVTVGAKLKGKNRLAATVSGKEEKLKLREDYVPLTFSASGAAAAPVVFVGYGASAPEFGYDDYMHMDVKDKIVLVLRNEPPGFQQKSGNQGPTHHALLITKAINARVHGAKAVVLVNAAPGKGEEDLLMKFGQAGPEDAGIPIVQVKRAVADRWLGAEKTSLDALQKAIDEKSQPDSRSLPESMKVALEVDIERIHKQVANVLAYLPGKTDEYVIVGGHYDHLGRGGQSSLAPSLVGQVHPGADDNASGAAGVLELARLFAAERGKLQRGVLFMEFAGEELGILGSSWWVKHPTRPLEKAVAMLNMDMIGRIAGGKVFIGGVGTGSTLKALVEGAVPKHQLTVDYSASGYAASDHTSFVTQKIPVLFFFSGLHSDYHKPSDTWEKIDAASAARLLDLVAELTSDLAGDTARPQFVRVETDQRPAGGGGGGYGPYFGSIPDFGQVETGVKFADVRPGSPAAKAGIKGGDILVQWNEMQIKNLQDFTFALRKSKVGDVVEVKVLRGSETMTFKVTLEQRK